MKLGIRLSALAIITLFVSLGFAKGEFNRTMPNETELQTIINSVTPDFNNYNVMKTLIGSEGGCEKFNLHLNFFNPNTNSNDSEDLTLYRPTNAAIGIPTILVIPTIMGETVIDKQAASKFCAINMNAIVADVMHAEEPDPYPDFQKEQRTLSRSLIILRLAIDYSKRFEKIKSRSIGVYGVSLGSIAASMLIGIDDRIGAAVLVAGGANVPAIMATSKNRKVASIRQKRLEYLPTRTAQAYFAEIDKNLRLDPLFFKTKVAPQNILMVASTGDTQVGFPFNDQLRAHLGNPARVLYNSLDHVAAILSFHYTQFKRATDWFSAKL